MPSTLKSKEGTEIEVPVIPGDAESKREISLLQFVYDFQKFTDLNTAPGEEHVNPVLLFSGTWFYACVDNSDEITVEKDGGEKDGKEIILDCVSISWFEGQSPDFDTFYPDDVDASELPSFVHLYQRDLKQQEAKDFAVRMIKLADYVDHTGSKPNAAHRSAVEKFHSKPERFCVLKLEITEETPIDTSVLGQNRWFAIELMESETGPGLNVDRLDHSQLEEQEPQPVRQSILRIFELDIETQRRLARVISLDFVPDAYLGPPRGGTVLLPPSPIVPLEPKSPYKPHTINIRLPATGSLFGTAYLKSGMQISLMPGRRGDGGSDGSRLWRNLSRSSISNFKANLPERNQ